MRVLLRFSVRVSLLWLLLLGSALGAEQGLLWQLSGKGATAYLFGTMHSDDPRVTTLPQEVERRFDEADLVMLEIDLNEQTQMTLMQEMMLPEGQSLSAIVGEVLGRKTQQAMSAYGIPPEVTERMQPWAAILTLSTPKMQGGVVLDMLLYQRTRQEGKAFAPLEQPAEQLAVFTGLSDREQKALLSHVLQEYQDYPQMFRQLTEAYLQRDLAAIMALSDANPMSGDPALQQKMMEKLLDQRNRRMVSRLIPQLGRGRVFVGVGALHLPGEQGLVNLLRQQGYQLTLLY